MKLTLIVATLVAAIGAASALQTYVPYALIRSELQPENYDFVLMPIQEGILHVEQGIEVSSPNEQGSDPDNQEIVTEEPKSRVRRQATVDVTRNTRTGSTSVSLQGQGNLWARGPHRVDGNAHYSRVFGGRQGTMHPTYGGGLTYSNSNGASAGVDISRQRPFGTQVSVQAQRALWRSNDGRTSVDANANWSRNYGGAFGTSRPNYGGMVTFRHRF